MRGLPCCGKPLVSPHNQLPLLRIVLLTLAALDYLLSLPFTSTQALRQLALNDGLHARLATVVELLRAAFRVDYAVLSLIDSERQV